MKSNKKALIVVSSLVILGVGGYFLYTSMKKKKMEKDAKIQADSDAAKSEGQKLADEAKADAAVEVAKAKGASELDLANTWIRTAKGANSPMLTFDDEFKIALWKANTSNAATFIYKGKTYTKGGSVYVPLYKGKEAIGRTATTQDVKFLPIRSSAADEKTNVIGYLQYPKVKLGQVIDYKEGWYKIRLAMPTFIVRRNSAPIDISGKVSDAWVKDYHVNVK
jgi:hypothetical protein